MYIQYIYIYIYVSYKTKCIQTYDNVSICPYHKICGSLNSLYKTILVDHCFGPLEKITCIQ